MQKILQEIQKTEILSGLNQVCDYAADPVVPTKKSKQFTEKCKKFSKISKKKSQELRMLSSVTINRQVTKIAMKPGSQLSVL